MVAVLPSILTESSSQVIVSSFRVRSVEVLSFQSASSFSSLYFPSVRVTVLSIAWSSPVEDVVFSEAAVLTVSAWLQPQIEVQGS